MAKHSIHFDTKLKWTQYGITVAGSNADENDLNHQLYSPWNIDIDDDEQNIYIADMLNHRILAWKCGASSGQVIAGGKGQGNRPDQLDSPMSVIVDKKTDSLIISDTGNKRILQWSRRNAPSGQIIISNIYSCGLAKDNYGYFYASDFLKHEVRRWNIGDSIGTIVAGGNGSGSRLDQLAGPTNIFVDNECSIYVSDLYNHRVVKWIKGAKDGVIVAGGNGFGSNLTQLFGPRGLIVDQSENVYVSEYVNNRVICWPKGASEGILVVGGNGYGNQSDKLFGPLGLSFDRQGNLYVVDLGNNRIQKFKII